MQALSKPTCIQPCRKYSLNLLLRKVSPTSRTSHTLQRSLPCKPTVYTTPSASPPAQNRPGPAVGSSQSQSHTVGPSAPTHDALDFACGLMHIGRIVPANSIKMCAFASAPCVSSLSSGCLCPALAQLYHAAELPHIQRQPPPAAAQAGIHFQLRHMDMCMTTLTHSLELAVREHIQGGSIPGVYAQTRLDSVCSVITDMSRQSVHGSAMSGSLWTSWNPQLA